MKFLFVYSFILAALFTIESCDILKPEEGKIDDNIDTNAVSVGPEGGTIAEGNFSIIIPAGAFQQTAKIKVSLSGVNITGENIVTPIYSIEGLPDNYSLPIDIAIKLNDSTNNDSYLVVQDNAFTSSAGGAAPSNFYIETILSGDSLKGRLPALNSNLAKGSSLKPGADIKSPAGIFSLNIFGSSNKKSYLSGNGHFKIIYDASKDNLDNVTNLGASLEVSYYKIKDDLGFNFGRRTSWPVTVSIGDLKGECGHFSPSKWSVNSSSMMFDRSRLGDQNDVKRTAIHEFFHLVQYLYDPRGAFRQGSFAPDNYWLNEACSVWSEGLVEGSDYIPDNWLSNQLTPFNGFEAGAAQDPESHGYGMAAFVKYLVNQYGKTVLVKIYEKIYENKLVIDAINKSINYNLFMICNPFFKQYVRGNIYWSFGTGNLAQLVEDKFEIKTESDTLKNFTSNYKDLSAKVYLVKLENPDFEHTDSLEISIDQNLCDITVFKYPETGSNVIGEGQNKCVIPDLKALNLEHKRLFVMVTNSNYIANNYQPSNLDINLKMKVLTHKIRGISVRLKLADYQYRYCDSTGCEDRTGLSRDPAFYFSSGLLGGSWNMNNNVFTGKLDNVENLFFPDNQNVSGTGTMVITFLENPLRVNVLINADIESIPGSSEQWTRHYHLEINEVPGSYNSYYQSGPALSRMNFIYKWNYEAFGHSYSEEYINSSFNYESYIDISIFR